MSAWQHVQAIVGMVADPDLPMHCAPIENPVDDDFPYCFVSLPGAMLDSERMASTPHVGDFGFQTTIVALSPESASIAAGKLYDALALRRPVIAGRVVGRVRQLTAPRITDADDALPGRLVTTVIDQWQFDSTDAS